MGRTWTLTVGQEDRDPMEIDVGWGLYAVTFSTDGEYVLSGGDGVRVWRVEDGKKMATMKANAVKCLAVSNDGRWIAAGTIWGHVHVWDAKTYKQVFTHREGDWDINRVDFSRNSSRLVSASNNGTVIVWDIATRQRVQTLRHEDLVIAAKYSPEGDRIATATGRSVRVYDSNGGVLVDINATVYNSGLVWFNNHLLVVSDGQIKQFDASTGSAVSEWLVPDTNELSCIGLPKHGEFIACSTKRTVTFWDMATHTQLGLIDIRHPEDIRSVALSPDDRFIATGGWNGKIVIESLFRIITSVSTVPHSIVIYHFSCSGHPYTWDSILLSRL